MASVFDNFFSQAATGDTIKDWDHASRLYVSNNYNLAPKSSFLFHVYFELNQNAIRLNGMEDSHGKQIELGMLVKSVSLPKFTADMATLNAYNRPHVIQKKMNHSPVQIAFHDDSANVVRNFWFDYYSYYYRNSDYGGDHNLEPYPAVHKEITHARNQKDWGYSIRGSTSQNGTPNITAPYLNAIRIYSLHNKQFSEYILINPIIKDFSHGQHNASEGAGTMEHTMSVEYETVLYAYGKVSPANVKGFADLHYDKRPSPLSAAGGGTKSLLGPGGLMDAAGEITQDLQNGNVASALFKGARVGNGLKGANLGTLAAAAAGSLGAGILGSLGGTGVTNPFGAISVPGIGGMLSSPLAGAGGLVGGLATTISPSLGISNISPPGGLPGFGSITGVGKGLATAAKSAAPQIDSAVRSAKANLPGGQDPKQTPQGTNFQESD